MSTPAGQASLQTANDIQGNRSPILKYSDTGHGWVAGETQTVFISQVSVYWQESSDPLTFRGKKQPIHRHTSRSPNQQ